MCCVKITRLLLNYLKLSYYDCAGAVSNVFKNVRCFFIFLFFFRIRDIHIHSSGVCIYIARILI